MVYFFCSFLEGRKGQRKGEEGKKSGSVCECVCGWFNKGSETVCIKNPPSFSSLLYEAMA